MASIQSLGIGSGLLTTELLENIISAEREATDLRLDAEQAEAEAKLSAFGTIRSSLDSLRSAAAALESRSAFADFTTSSSNSSVATATVGTDAVAGTYQIEVDQIARNEVLATGGYASLDTVVGSGTISIAFGTTSYDVDDNYAGFTVDTEIAGGELTIDSTNNTLAGIRDAINSANLGVRANIIDDGTGFRLAITSENDGAGGSMRIEVTEDAPTGLSDLRYDETTRNLTQTVKGQDAQLTVDGISISRATNTIDNVVEGVTINALSAAAGSPVTLSVQRDLDAAAERLEGFVSAYNDFKDQLDELTKFDPETQEGGLLLGDSALRSTAGRLSRVLSSPIDNPFDANIRALVDVGITTNRSYRLEFDRPTFEANAANVDSIASVFAANARIDDSQITYFSSQTYSRSGDYALTVTRLAQQGLYRSNTVAGIGTSGVTIDADNDTLRVQLNAVSPAGGNGGGGGITSGEITLAAGSYTAEEFALELERAINSDASIRAAQRSVAVAFDAANERYTITSPDFGSTSSVGILSVDTDTEAELGIAVFDGAATAGSDVEVRIGGYAASGSGRVVLVDRENLEAAPGFLTGSSTSALQAADVTIDADNKTFEISVDGTASASITLTEGSYTDMAALASEIQDRINADANLTGAEASVLVSYDQRNERFEIVSGTAGAESSVAITSADAALTTTLGLGVGAGFSGTAASPRDQSIGPGGLQFGVFGGATGPRGQIEFVRGVADQFESVLDELLTFGGTLTNREDALREDLSDISDERARFDARISAQEARLQKQFALNDALIAQLNSTSDFLSSQLDLLPLANSGGE